MATYYTPISTSTGVANTADVFNTRFQQLDNAIINSKNGTIETVTEVFSTPITLTLDSNTNGSIYVTQSRHLIDTYASGASGDLVTINGGTAGQIIYLQSVNSSRLVTIRHNDGNIVTSTGADYTLFNDRVIALFYNGTTWSDIGSASAVSVNTQRFSLSAPAASMSISNIPSTYKHLFLIVEARTDAAATTDNILLRANADSTAANYYTQYSTVSNTTTTSAEVLGASAGILIPSGAIGNTGSAGVSFVTVWIGNYASTSQRRLFHARSAGVAAATTGNIKNTQCTGSWQNITTAISSLTILPVTGTNLAAGTSMTLYGYN